MEKSEEIKGYFEQGITKLEIKLNQIQKEQILEFANEFWRWNKVHNLSAVDNTRDFVFTHLLDSLAVVRPITDLIAQGLLSKKAKFADLGTGGGFPGILLSIMFVEHDFVLVDAVKKKTAFLHHIKGKLKLKNVEVVEGRIENHSKSHPNSVDATISRAFAELSTFVSYSLPLLKDMGLILAMKSQKINEEIQALSNECHLIRIEELMVPNLNAYRCLAILQSNHI